MDLDLTAFITIEVLKSFTGQAMVIVVVTQLIKELARGWVDEFLPYIAGGIGLWCQLVTNFLAGPYLGGTLIVIKGAVVALVAMKTKEMMKSKKE